MLIYNKFTKTQLLEFTAAFKFATKCTDDDGGMPSKPSSIFIGDVNDTVIRIDHIRFVHEWLRQYYLLKSDSESIIANMRVGIPNVIIQPLTIALHNAMYTLYHFNSTTTAVDPGEVRYTMQLYTLKNTSNGYSYDLANPRVAEYFQTHSACIKHVPRYLIMDTMYMYVGRNSIYADTMHNIIKGIKI